MKEADSAPEDDPAVTRARKPESWTAAGIATILASLGDSPRELRDATLLPMASDTLCRKSERVAIRVEDLHHSPRRNSR